MVQVLVGWFAGYCGYHDFILPVSSFSCISLRSIFSLHLDDRPSTPAVSRPETPTFTQTANLTGVSDGYLRVISCKARKFNKLFGYEYDPVTLQKNNGIGWYMIERITCSADSISRLTNIQIRYIIDQTKSKTINNVNDRKDSENVNIVNDQDNSVIDSSDELSVEPWEDINEKELWGCEMPQSEEGSNIVQSRKYEDTSKDFDASDSSSDDEENKFEEEEEVPEDSDADEYYGGYYYGDGRFERKVSPVSA
ncbi:hypothetical protein C1645_804697 [Glomus cerebriforme]|uniref:Uncharacterized protein n=1 Tax=Glomus cerebriforme TaxID=658196 RepID=A0A397T4X7_9GLOM|nr:hypothetical protein C1645_804697 [Glomus cerebriforme]